MTALRSLTEQEAALWSPPTTSEATITRLSASGMVRRETSWHARDLTAALDGSSRSGPTTSILLRTDGTGLLYPGKAHAFVGEPESGKTWLALFAILQVINAGRVATLIDFEDDEHGIVSRLLALGADRASIAERFRYLRVDDPLDPDEDLDLLEELSHQPVLVVLDGVTEAMTLHGWSGDSADDVAAFHRRIVRRIARTGPAVVLIDHVVKSGDARGRWATGSQHKLAALDGAQYVVERRTPWAPGHTGSASIRIVKDRPGAVRSILPDRRTVGDLVFTCGPSHVDLEIRPVHAEHPAADGGRRDTRMMERCSVYLAAHPDDEHSGNAIRTAVKGDHKAIDRALVVLGLEGYLDLNVNRNGHYHRHVRSYTEASDQRGGDKVAP